MKKQEVLDHFGGVIATAKSLGISQPSVSNWTDPLPELRQLELEQLTGGRLKAGPECDKYRVPVTT
jgi:transcriptional repressor of cell division inhibition gene dicB